MNYQSILHKILKTVKICQNPNSMVLYLWAQYLGTVLSTKTLCSQINDLSPDFEAKTCYGKGESFPGLIKIMKLVSSLFVIELLLKGCTDFDENLCVWLSGYENGLDSHRFTKNCS